MESNKRSKPLQYVKLLVVGTVIATVGTTHVVDKVNAHESHIVKKKTASKKFTTTTTVSMLSTPSVKSKILLKIQTNEIVSSESLVDGWHKVSYNGQIGYIESKFLKSYTPSKTTKFASKKYTTTANLSLRKSYSVKSTRLNVIPKGKLLVSNEKYKGWYKVKYSKKTGWVSGAYLKAYIDPKPSRSLYPSLAKSVYDQYDIEMMTTKYGSFFTLSDEYSHAYGADSNRLIISVSSSSKDDESFRIASKVLAKLTGNNDSDGIYRSIKNSSMDKLTEYKGLRISNSGNALSVYL